MTYRTRLIISASQLRRRIPQKDMLNPEAIAKTKPRGDLKSPRDLSHIIYKLLFHGNNTVQKRILIGLTG